MQFIQPVIGPVNCLVLFHGRGTAIAIRKRRVSTLDRPCVQYQEPFMDAINGHFGTKEKLIAASLSADVG